MEGDIAERLDRLNLVRVKFTIRPEQADWLREAGEVLDLSASRLVREGIEKMMTLYGDIIVSKKEAV